MPIVDVKTLKPGQTISFTSKEPNDAVTYYGDIEAIGRYSATTKYGDITARYQAMRKHNPSIVPMTELDYFIIKVNQNGKLSYFIIATDWIEPTSIQVIEHENYFDIRVYMSPSGNITEILNLLKTHGFQCSETPKK